ncbi:MAG: hypothetical protein WCP33_08140 [Deltaproteobacteria bacterium]
MDETINCLSGEAEKFGGFGDGEEFTIGGGVLYMGFLLLKESPDPGYIVL